MTDITELAQSLKAAANTTADAIDRLKAFPGDELIDLSQHEGEQVDIDIATLNQWYELSSPANIRALVEALEKAQRANAAQDDHINQQQDRIEALEKKNAELGKYAGKLETINAAAEKLVRCKGRYHSEQNYRALAALFGVTTPDLPSLDGESRTVKLPKPHAHLIWIQAGHAPDDFWDDVAVSHSEKDRCCDGSERYPVYARWEVEEALTAAGIKWEAE
ncbi:ead/Ea22-like family protein [Klebsiella michiganensis]|uniref:ead/Ea22-like family protein n=1 Tax=Klebsiella michiganensis TaxID=1134687 RepID=UPI0015A68CD0|nr:ead/Ea22-like family protein [Klebsiella michiganensis]